MIREMLSENLWLLLTVQATLCIGVGLAASFLLRRSAAKAHQVLLTALVAAVLTPGTYVLVRHFQLGVLPSKTVPVAPQGVEPIVSLDAPAVDLPSIETEYEPVRLDVPDPVAPASARKEVAAAPLPWATICLGCWTTLSVILLSRVVLRFALGLRLLRETRPVASERLGRAIESAKARMGIACPIRLRSSERLKSPIIWCWTRRPVLLIHMESQDRQGDADWVSVFCHELAHLRRGDHVSGLFTEVLTALLPWHPLLWWAASRLAKLSEQACDDWVLAAGQSGVDYAETLLGLTAQKQMAFVPTMMGKEKTMSTRICRIIKDRCGDPRVGARWVAGVSILAILAVVSVGFAQRRPVEREEQEVGIVMERREPQERREPVPAWQREVLHRKLEELARQISEKETLLREAGDMPPEERRMQEFELDLVREMSGQIERRLRNLERPGPRTPLEADRKRDLDEQLKNLRREQEEITKVRQRTERELKDLRDNQSAEANELRGRLRELREQSRRLDDAMAELERARVPTDRPAQAERRTAEREFTVVRTRAQEQTNEETAALRRRHFAERLRALTARAEEIEQQRRSFGDAEPDRTRSLEIELNKIRDAIGETEQELGKLEERGRTRPGVELEMRDRPPEIELRRGYLDPYGGGAYGGRTSRATQPAGRGGRERPIRPEARITRVFRVAQGNLVQRRDILQSVLDTSGQVTADERTSSLVVTATPEGQERVERVIRRLDAPAGNPDLRNEVEDLRNQMNGLREQLQEMQGLLRQVAERERGGTSAP